MAMNENEGGSAYPPNPGVKSGSCLIDGFHALTDIHPSYWNAYKTDWSVFGNERMELRETLESFDPSLPRFGAGKLREKLSAAQSSIESLLSAMDSRAASEQELRELGSKWKSLEAEYRARSNI